MDEAGSFDLHLAECTAQAAAIWLVLNEILRLQLENVPGSRRTEFLDGLVELAETLILPVSNNPERSDAPEWIAQRYRQLMETFTARHRA